MKKYEEFKITVDDKELDMRVYEPTLEDQREANKVRNEAFSDALSSKAPLRSQLHMIMKLQGTWTEKQDAEFERLSKEINEAEHRLNEGGFKLDEAYELAMKVRKLRRERRNLLIEMSRLDNNTAEGQADNMAFNYLVSACLVYNQGGKEKKYFKDLNDYLNKSDGEVAIAAANKLSSLMYGIGDDVEKSLTENKFLVDFGFADENLKLRDKQGRLIDEEGRLIDEEGRFIDENGNYIDIHGNSVDQKGEPKTEFKGFIDEDGAVVMGKSHTAEQVVEEEISS